MGHRAVNGLDVEWALPAGARLGPYEVVSPLGAGGVGEVYRAIDTRLAREVAIKLLSRRAAAVPSQRRRFDREAQLASAVSHPHVLTVFDVGEWRGLPYVVTELLEGETLRARLRPGLLPAREAVDFGAQIARGLAALHARGIVHRDLKPENLFVTADGRIKILDLGLAGLSTEGDRVAGAPWDVLTTEGASAFGTAAYMSPEQVRRSAADPRSDIFACGVVLYEMLAGRRPFDEETGVETMTAILRAEPPPLLDLAPALPPALAALVARCLEKRAESRFHSAHDLALALEAVFAPGPPSASRSTTPPPSVPEPKERPLEATVPGSPRGAGARGRGASVALSSLAVLAVTAAWFFSREPQRGAAPKGEIERKLATKQAAPPVRGQAALHAYDSAQGRFAPYLDGLAAEGVDFSRDGRFVVYVSYPDGTLWRSRVDGSDRLRLTSAPLRGALPRFSPDGRRIAFAGRSAGGPWKVHLVSADGGAHTVLPPDHVTDPGWSHDGRSLVFGSGAAGGPTAILRWDLASGNSREVPGSQGLFSPRPSPDGRWLAGLRRDGERLMIQEADSGAWTRLTAHAVGYPEWTRDSAWLHFRRSDERAGFSRIDPTGRREETVAPQVHTSLTTSEWGAWSGLTPEGAPLLLLDLGKQSLAGRSSLVPSAVLAAWTVRSGEDDDPVQRGTPLLVEASASERRKTAR